MGELMGMDWSRWPNFSEKEFRCPSSGRADMDAAFMDRLQELRKAFGKPMVITSGYRSPEHNAKVSETGAAGPHTTGKAVDFLISGEDAYTVLSLAISMGFTGIGLRQHGDFKRRFMHLDRITGDLRPRVWTYNT